MASVSRVRRSASSSLSASRYASKRVLGSQRWLRPTSASWTIRPGSSKAPSPSVRLEPVRRASCQACAECWNSRFSSASVPTPHEALGDRGVLAVQVASAGRSQQDSHAIRPPRPDLPAHRVDVAAEDVLAYIACIVAHPAYTRRFRQELGTPGIRVPMTANRELWNQTVALGRHVIWLHTYGERFVDPRNARPVNPDAPGVQRHEAFR